jgi:Ni/Co efflux regulator RcnB
MSEDRSKIQWPKGQTMAHKTLHRKQNMEKHQSRSMPKPEAYVQWYKHDS